MTAHRTLALAKNAIFFLAIGILQAQSAETAKFDVASVKRHVSGSGYESLKCSNGRLISIGEPLILIIRWAYDLNQDQLRDMQQRLPNWMFPGGGNTSTLAYDIQATSERQFTESQCKAALQALLADRFKLAAHWEAKEAEVSDLVVARGGPKMQRAAAADQERGFTITINGRPVSTAPGGTVPAGETMQEFADFLSFLRPHQPVIDKTGLEGRYKMVLRFSDYPPGRDQGSEDPDLETALQQQLGLRLQTHKGTVKVFLVDHIEPPTAN